MATIYRRQIPVPLIPIETHFVEGGGDYHVKQTGMLVVSLRGVNYGCLVSLGVFWENAIILSHYVSFRVACEEIVFLVSFRGNKKLEPLVWGKRHYFKPLGLV